MGCSSSAGQGGAGSSNFEDKKKVLTDYLEAENSKQFQSEKGNEAAKKVCMSNMLTITVGPEGKFFRLWNGIEATLEWTDFQSEWEMSGKKINWMVDGPHTKIIFQNHYTPKYKATGKQAPTMEDLMLAEVHGKKLSLLKYYWSNPGAVNSMVTEDSVFQKLGHMFHHESSAPFLNLNPDATSDLGPKELALRALLDAWRTGKLETSAEGAAEKAAEHCTADVQIVAVGPTGPQYKVYDKIEGVLDWFTFQSKEESHDWKVNWMVNGPDTAVICQVRYTAKVKETSVTCETVEDILVAKIVDDKVSHLQYYWDNISETSKLHPVE
eukprot:CAMPEP_0172681336 /NCGR_PEP_ID=MMETSP1074-20121228/17375_1 /TAXON_ID=2916 /ORGANISM="Ceratium fusus, Strain PA161109" /LENGTH=324 /DNA_ID=CAMNT_0013499815 /DNA_START=35 /DNA_END=1009 /DNA_ORIENTATION=-